MLSKTIVGLLVTGLVFTGCAQQDGGSAGPTPAASADCEPEPEATPGLEGVTNCTMEAAISVTVDGARSFTDEGTYLVAINEFFGGQLPEATWFANLGMASPQNLDRETLYRVAFDIAPGTYRGPGTYELSPDRPDVEGLSSPLTDRVVVEYTNIDPETGVDAPIFEGMLEPCTLKAQDTLTRGSLECPKLRDESGEEISLAFRWEPA